MEETFLTRLFACDQSGQGARARWLDPAQIHQRDKESARERVGKTTCYVGPIPWLEGRTGRVMHPGFVGDPGDGLVPVWIGDAAWTVRLVDIDFYCPRTTEPPPRAVVGLPAFRLRPGMICMTVTGLWVRTIARDPVYPDQGFRGTATDNGCRYRFRDDGTCADFSAAANMTLAGAWPDDPALDDLDDDLDDEADARLEATP